MDFQVDNQAQDTIGSMNDGDVAITLTNGRLAKDRLIVNVSGRIMCIDEPRINIEGLAEWRTIPVKILPKGTKITLTV